MTEAGLLTDLATNYGFLLVDPSPRVLIPEDGKLITTLSVEVVESGLSEATKKPIATVKSIEYYVYKRGQGVLEDARYKLDEPVNDTAKDVSDGASNIGLSNLFLSPVLRKKCIGSMINYSYTVFTEDPGTTNHTNRIALVKNLLVDMDTYLEVFMFGLVLSSTVKTDGAAVADSVIDARITSLWNNIANLYVPA